MLQDGTLDLIAKEGVAFVSVLFKDFAVPFFKPTLFLHHIPTLHHLREVQPAWVGKTVPLKGVMFWEGKLQFRAHVAQAHPPILAERYAVLVKQA